MSIRLPTKSDHLIIIGKNGSGKTLAGLWHLKMADRSIPWVIIDYKGDKSIASINPEPFDIGKLEPGHIYRIAPIVNDPNIEPILWQLWQRENVGIFIDESYMIPNGDAINAILTQGRSKCVPVIALTQRPVFVPRFFFSEANFFQTFWLNDKRDRQLVASFQPAQVNDRLERYHSFYYDVNRDQLNIMLPVPLPEPFGTAVPLPQGDGRDAPKAAPERRIKVI
jgi:hypothetical protein